MSAADRWVQAQKRAFTAWMNIQLAKRGIAPVNDIFTDLEDGVTLCQLVEIILNVKLQYTPREKIKMVFPKLENLKRAIDELKKHVRLSVDGPAIRAGDPRLILGMLWTIILRVQISDISIEQRTAKEGLLLWCQRKLAGLPDVCVRDFTNSWKDGLALCGLIYKHQPALIPFDTLNKANAVDNLNLAFTVAEQQLHIPKMLDAAEVAAAPDELAVMTYVTQFFHHFSAGAKSEIATRRIGKLVDLTKSNDELKAEYERLATELVHTLEGIVTELDDRSFDNTLAGAQQKMRDFEEFKGARKPALTTQKLEAEAAHNSIVMKLRTCGRPPYESPAACSLAAIDGLWARMEEAETKRAVALREELLKQKNLASCDAQFEGKITGLERWCADKRAFLENSNVGDTLQAVQNNMKMQEAFDDEYRITRQAREAECIRLADQMVALHYKEAAITERVQALRRSLDEIQELAAKRKAALDEASGKEGEKEKMRKEFAGLVADFTHWASATEQTLCVHTFPDSLEAITAYRETLEASEKNVQEACNNKVAALADLDGRMKASGVVDNKYTAVMMSDITAQSDQITAAIKARHDAYEKELERQKGLEERRLAFAEAARSFVDAVDALRAQIDSVTDGEFEARIAKVNKLFAGGEAMQARLKALEETDRENTAAGVLTNPHTPFTIQLLAARWSELQHFVESTLSRLNEQIVMRDRARAQDAEFAVKEKRDAVCIEYAQKAIALHTFIESVQSALSAPLVDTETLSDAQQLKEQFDGVIVAGYEQQKPAFDDVRSANEKMAAEGVTANPFCHITFESLTEKWSALEKSIEERKKRVADELERQKICEELRQDFATKAQAMVQWCTAHKKAITELAGELPRQLEEAKKREAEIDAAKDESLAEVQKIAHELSEMGVTTNQLTDLDIYTVQAMYTNLVTLVKRSIGVIEQRLDALRLGDVTPEELREYRECFDRFDVDHSGGLQKHELKACLASLGQDLSDAEMDALMKQLVNEETAVPFDKFTQYMKNRTKDTDSKDEVIASFKEIAKDKPFVTADELRAANLEAPHVDYLVAHMPPKEAGFDYVAFTEMAFSR